MKERIAAGPFMRAGVDFVSAGMALAQRGLSICCLLAASEPRLQAEGLFRTAVLRVQTHCRNTAMVDLLERFSPEFRERYPRCDGRKRRWVKKTDVNSGERTVVPTDMAVGFS